jgi:hypothetical protein
VRAGDEGILAVGVSFTSDPTSERQTSKVAEFLQHNPELAAYIAMLVEATGPRVPRAGNGL